MREPVTKLKPVQVRIVEVNWLQKRGRELFYYLAKNKDENIYENELIKVLLLEQNYTY